MLKGALSCLPVTLLRRFAHATATTPHGHMFNYTQFNVHNYTQITMQMHSVYAYNFVGIPSGNLLHSMPTL